MLGSGGARGLAHIGVIEWLEENGYEIRSIAGSSMGALVGGIYAAGELDAYKHWVTALDKTDVLRLLDLSFHWSGLLKGERVIEKLKDLIEERDIEDLPISFAAVATDLERQKEVWLTRGPLFDAIRASIAVPTLFTPWKVNGRRLFDGGIVNPLPIAPTLADSAALTVAVNLSGRPDETPTLPARPRRHRTERQGKDPGYHSRIQAFIAEWQERLSGGGDKELDFLDVLSLSLDAMQNTIARLNWRPTHRTSPSASPATPHAYSSSTAPRS